MLSYIPFFHQFINLPLKFLYLLQVAPIGWSIWNRSTGYEINWCSIPQIGGKPCGVSSEKTSSYSCKKKVIKLGKVGSSSLVFKNASLYKSTIISWYEIKRFLYLTRSCIEILLFSLWFSLNSRIFLGFFSYFSRPLFYFILCFSLFFFCSLFFISSLSLCRLTWSL